MQLAMAPKSDIISSGVLAESAFGFAVNGKAFRILSDTLYQNKIGSIARELSCNAADSHIAAGKADVPFEIHLPNNFEPWFAVTDTGLGLSHDGVMRVYTTFFESTKDSSNDQVGAFGLGSKTPFAYTDAFTVNSVYNGVRRTYSAMVREDGTPAMSLLAEEATESENGVEVMIPVEQKDFRAFNDEVANQLAFFKVKPRVRNALYGTFKFTDHSVNVKYPLNCGMDIFTDNSQRHPRRTMIVQGGVGYPLDYANLMRNPQLVDLRQFIDEIQVRGANLYFNIGEIEVTPSREGISYSDRTINNIIAKFNKARAEFFSTVEIALDSLKNNWERAVYINEGGALVRSCVKGNNKYAIPFTSDYVRFATLPAKLRDTTISITKDDGTVVTQANKVKHYDVITYFIKDTGVNVSSVDNNAEIEPRPNTYILVQDDCKAPIARIRNFVRNLDNRGARVHVYTPRVLSTDPRVVTVMSSADIDIWEASMGGIKATRVSTLPEPTRTYNTVAREGYMIPKIWTMKGSTLEDSVRHWQAIYDPIKDLVDGGYYLVVDERKLEHFNHSTGSIVTILARHNMLDKPVFAIRKKDVAKIANNPDWVPLVAGIDALKNELIAKYKPMIPRLAYAFAVRSRNVGGFDYDMVRFLQERISEIADSALRNLFRVNDLTYSARVPPIAESLLMHDSVCAAQINELRARFNARFELKQNKMKEKYSLLTYLRFPSYECIPEKMKQQVLDYIASIA